MTALPLLDTPASLLQGQIAFEECFLKYQFRDADR